MLDVYNGLRLRGREHDRVGDVIPGEVPIGTIGHGEVRHRREIALADLR